MIGVVAVLACESPAGVELVAPPAGGGVEAVALAGGQRADPPATEGALAPRLSPTATGVHLSWLEPVELVSGAAGHRLRFATLSDGAWGEPVTVAEGADFFANWADTPAIGEASAGWLVAAWPEKVGSDTYAYAPALAWSDDRGRSWRRHGFLPADQSPSEHGFVSLVREDGGLRAFWLDGREMLDGGAMTLRSRTLGRSGEGIVAGPEELLDERVCECCNTAAVATAAGPLVAYRDRSGDEVRDVAALRRGASGWSEPRLVAGQGWRIDGCPVNGPALAARDGLSAIAWFSAADGRPRVLAALSEDAGASFAPPLEIDGGAPIGRVDVVADPAGGVVVSWLETVGDVAQVRLRRLDAAGLGAPTIVGETAPSRAAGFPRMALLEPGRLGVVWVELDAAGVRRLRFVHLDLATVPPAGRQDAAAPTFRGS